MKFLYLLVILSICVFLFCGRPEKVTIKSPTEKNRDEVVYSYEYTQQIENRNKIETTDFAANPGQPADEIATRIRYDLIDEHVRNTPESAEKSPEHLIAYLNKPAQNDFERVRAIYRWITMNIDYDIEAFQQRSRSYVIPDDIFRARLAVCYGFSILFKHLSQLAGLESVLIGGWARGRTGVERIFDDENLHAWNAVKIENGWYLLDCTWGAGVLNDNQFLKQPIDFYFLTDPQKLIYTHFPEIPKCQLLPEITSKEEYARWPLVRNRVFEHQVDFSGNSNGIIKVEKEGALSFKTPADILLVARLNKDSQNLDSRWTFSQRIGTHYQMYFKLPEPGHYTFGIYGRKRDQNEAIFSDLVWYQIKSNSFVEETDYFPQTTEYFQKRDIRLITPLNGLLISGQSQLFKIQAPEALRVAAVNNEEWFFLKNNSDEWEGELLLKPGKLVLFANYVVGNRFEGLIVYEVK